MGFLRIPIHAALFSLTFFTTTLAGVSWVNSNPFELSNFHLGLPYSLSILAILTAHEFGHYFAARYYGVDTTLPYFIPVPHFLLNPFGTMGAVIRIRSPLTTNRALFDIGIAGPLAGLVVTLGVLMYGLISLPGKEYLYAIHPEYQSMTAVPEGGLTFGYSAIFYLLENITYTGAYFPPMSEIYHYPYLCAAWFGMFITALNLMPVGQLDGGHILYALVGSEKQVLVAKFFFVSLVVIGVLGMLPVLDPGMQFSTTGWLVWAIIMLFLIKLRHPEIPDAQPLDHNRRILGWGTLLLLPLMFPPIPFMD